VLGESIQTVVGFHSFVAIARFFTASSCQYVIAESMTGHCIQNHMTCLSGRPIKERYAPDTWPLSRILLWQFEECNTIYYQSMMPINDVIFGYSESLGWGLGLLVSRQPVMYAFILFYFSVYKVTIQDIRVSLTSPSKLSAGASRVWYCIQGLWPRPTFSVNNLLYMHSMTSCKLRKGISL